MTDVLEKRKQLQDFIRFQPYQGAVSYTIVREEELGSYKRLLIHYLSEDGDTIPAYLLIPKKIKQSMGILALHQHASQRHFGKSEICGIVGNPDQRFGHYLAERGYVVLAPDSISFEDRRRDGVRGTEPHPRDELQHYNEMAYRLVQGDTLMRKVLSDTSVGLTLLKRQELARVEKVCILGHSYGGNITLFYSALDERVDYACASGAACSYRKKLANGIGLEHALVLPGFLQQFDLDDVIECIYPRPLYLQSADEDIYSLDADAIELTLREKHPDWNLTHTRYAGGHPLTPERTENLLKWVEEE